jgi:hypothetical protein
VYRVVRQRCRPSILILPLQHVDLQTRVNAGNDWATFARYVSGRSGTDVFTTYFRRWPLTLAWIRSGPNPFDQSGSGLATCGTSPLQESHRLDYLRRPVPEIRAQDLAPLEALIHAAAADRATVMVVRFPARLDTERTLQTDVSRRFWQAIEQTAERSGGQWVDLQNRGAYGDNEFYDFLHLNSCGARRVTDQLLAAVQSSGRGSR